MNDGLAHLVDEAHIDDIVAVIIDDTDNSAHTKCFATRRCEPRGWNMAFVVSWPTTKHHKFSECCQSVKQRNVRTSTFVDIEVIRIDPLGCLCHTALHF